MGCGRLLVVAGPTAVGKSETSLRLAARLDGEIVNADSMQLYRGMDIGTAKIPVADRRGVVHHQIDVLPIASPANVASYQRAARADISAILGRGRTPILVGGSALYIQAVIDQLDFPGTDPDVRARFAEQLSARGAGALHAELARLDPAAAAVVDAADGRRIVRALEVLEITGRPYAARLPTPERPRYDAELLWLDRTTTDLDERIARRVDSMLRNGFLDEVAALTSQGLATAPTAARALGYAQLLEVVAGRTSLAQARVATVTATRRFVRRQRSWFRRDPRWQHLDAAAPDLLEQIAVGLADH